MASTGFLTVFVFVLTVLVSLIAVYLWRRATGYHQLLQEAANRFEEGRLLNQKLQADIEKLGAKLEESRQQVKLLKKSNDDTRQKNSHLIAEYKRLSDLEKNGSTDDKRKLSHLEEQLNEVTNQLRDSDKDKHKAEVELKELKGAFKSEVTKEVEKKDVKLRDMDATIRDLRNKIETKEKIHSAESQEELQDLQKQVKKMKKRLHQRDHLIASMRGLKEMAEERNHNWETALRHLSAKVLGLDAQKDKQKVSGPIGELVSKALSSFGQELIPEDEDTSIDLNSVSVSESNTPSTSSTT